MGSWGLVNELHLFRPRLRDLLAAPGHRRRHLASSGAHSSNARRPAPSGDLDNPPIRDRPPASHAATADGLLIIVVGLLFTLDNLGLVACDRISRYWPAGLIAVGLVKLWDSREGHGGAFGGFVITLVGLWLLLEATVDIRISFADMWPMLLVFVGGYLVWRGLRGQRRAGGRDDHSIVSRDGHPERREPRQQFPAFRGGDLTAIMGGCDIDLRQAAINGDAAIDVFALWGGIEIRVPENWTVTFPRDAAAGRRGGQDAAVAGRAEHRLVIRGVS